MFICSMQYFLFAHNYFCVAERVPVNHSSAVAKRSVSQTWSHSYKGAMKLFILVPLKMCNVYV